ncbi:peptide/nickel transport system permease protein [Paenarthrobacter nitroguajacolicus]|uniref:ABC transporter permease n=1 Tax=Paenarthrobacter nitroguajacolicus TaxID=211146 RepID=UPI00285AD839|nr:ABC transporter permease [Paenarthrobacter nitroguajacolicus]MDR6989193.1 peptide/nickel transport system permease protein [Paenarthrobacter nitroguajacolicus]
MVGFLSRRLISAILLAFVVTSVTFVLIFSNGPSIARAVLGQNATPEQVGKKATELGLDQPALGQFWEWLMTLITGGGVGRSFYTNEPVVSMMSSRVPVTLSIVVSAVILTAVLSAVVGVVAAVRGGWVDRGLQFFAILGVAIPNFVVAIVLILVFAIGLKMFPATGYVPVTTSVNKWLLSLALPVTAVVIGAIGGTAQQFRGTVSDVLKQDFVRTLRARGIPARTVIARHVLRNAAGPGLISLGLQTIGLFGAVVIIEQVFAIPGIGNLTVSSSLSGDIPVVMGCVLFTVGVVVVVNLLTDLATAWLNPKVRNS